MTNISGFSTMQAAVYNNTKEKAVEQQKDVNVFETEDIFVSSGVKIDPPDPNAPIADKMSTYYSEDFVKAYRESNKNYTSLDDYAKSQFESDSENPQVEDDYPKDEDGRYILSDKDREKLEDIYYKADDSIHARMMLEHGSTDAERYAEYVADNAKRQAKVQSIAKSIASGKQVPQGDEAFLREKASAIYQMAIMQKIMREKANEKVDSVLDDEDRKKAGGDLSASNASSQGAEGMQDIPEDQLPADVKLIRAVGDVLTGDKHVSSLEGIVDISRFDAMQTASISAPSMPSINVSI